MFKTYLAVALGGAAGTTLRLLDGMMNGGLVTLEKVVVVHYRAHPEPSPR